MMRMFEAYSVIFMGPFLNPQTVRLNIMRDGNTLYGHLHDCKAVCALTSVTDAKCQTIMFEEFRPKRDFSKQVVIYNGEMYKLDPGLLTINSTGEIQIYCDQDKTKGFEVEGKCGWKDITFGYLLRD